MGLSLLMTNPNGRASRQLKKPKFTVQTAKNHIMCRIQHSIEVVVFIEKIVKKWRQMQG
jgi:hypothetical protein